jgi:dihydrofolate reductase
MAKYVVSSTLTDPEWNNSTVISGDIAGAVTKLKAETAGDILVNGSLQLVHELVEHDLVDEYRLMVFPVVLGGGKPAFAPGGATRALQLTDSEVSADVVILTYQPKR